MIVGETIEVPRENTQLIRLSADELLKNHHLRTFHLREDGNGLVCAEGEKIIAAFPGTMFDVIPKRFYIYNPEDSMLKLLSTGVLYGKVDPPFQLFRYFDKDGNMQIYCLTATHILRFDGDKTIIVGENKGGTCAAVFHERIFSAKEKRVFYSKALDVSDWKEYRYGGGYIDLDTDGLGDIMGMVPYKEKLYLVRWGGFSSLRVLGDELNFKVAHMPMKHGAIVAGSVAICGESIGYFTSCGFYLFNGAQSVRAENSRYDEIDFRQPIKAVTCWGKYYALVTTKDGSKTIYCYDPVWKQAHFIENDAVDIAINEDVYFARGLYIYSLQEMGGVTKGFAPYLTAENIAFHLGEERMLRSVAIEGTGPFSVTVTSNRGSRTVKGNAWEVLKLRSPLRGSGFNIKINVAQADATKVRFQALRLSLTEERNEN